MRLRSHGRAGVSVAIIGLSGLLLAACQRNFSSQEAPPDRLHYKAARIEHGAQLYDNWVSMKTRISPGAKGTQYIAPVSRANPSYSGQKDKIQFAETWRCKECHGWDYSGRKWKTGKNGTDDKVGGLLETSRKSNNDIFWAIAKGGKGHRFGGYMTEQDIWALVKFIRKGIKSKKTRMRKDGSFKGDPPKGKSLFKKNCAGCHGLDGKQIDLSSRAGGQGLAWRVRNSPEIAMHRTLWGKFTSIKKANYFTPMPSAIVELSLSEQNVLDILAYIQKH